VSLFKFFGEQDAKEHGGPLFWSEALGGLPYRGTHAPVLTRDELESQVEVHHDYKVEKFDLEDEEQQKRYINIMTRVVNGWYILHKNLEITPMQRVLEWSQRYGELAPGAAARSASNGYSLSR
jgi:hypothetical protein